MKEIFRLHLIACLFSCSLFSQNITIDAPKIILKDLGFGLVFSGKFDGGTGYLLSINGQNFKPDQITSEKLFFNKIKISKTGTHSFSLLNELGVIYQFNKNVISGWISVLPPLIAIVLAFMSRSVIPSLFAAIWFGVWSLSGFRLGGIISSLLDSFHYYILNTLIDRDHAIITLFTLMLGGMVGIVYRSGGMHGIIQHMIKKANTPRRGQIAIWLFGIIIFFDDYSNTLIVGNTSRLLCDKLKISRQKLAYLVDSTSAPVATIAVITTWIGFQVGIIADALPGLDGLNEYAYILFIHSIPYNFYPFLAIIMVGFVVFSGKDIGPMVYAEKKARMGMKYNSDILETETESG